MTGRPVKECAECHVYYVEAEGHRCIPLSDVGRLVSAIVLKWDGLTPLAGHPLWPGFREEVLAACEYREPGVALRGPPRCTTCGAAVFSDPDGTRHCACPSSTPRATR